MEEEEMDEYLEEVLDIDNKNVRTKIIHEGYRSLEVLVKKDKAWVNALRLSIKKSTGNAASGDCWPDTAYRGSNCATFLGDNK
jgi:hypothetical protein